MADHQNDNIFDNSVPFLLFAVGSAAFMVTLYHCLVACWFRRGQDITGQQPQSSRPNRLNSLNSIDSSAAQLIPAHKHKKGLGLVGEDGACAVCLCEFEEGEELRTLPECMHSFHVPCIDMWLYSHPNCPVCRTDAVPSLHVSRHASDSDSVAGEVEISLDARTLQDNVLQTRRV
ncbi:RING-H2 finger protein ATL51 [Ziziphus jujuba]|uniref:RING-H2 finger protein ATL51 n=2 Tax=Ziziphus jujuba TaxID=326968 RepID=A0A6P3ZNP7_ZIZJJ|nr:RING-H2 finger protein ATL51 [Ziziphus jujuba]KAH7537226.1 hypothetical protein FEM48_Zijuj03G0070300 [Ziziphus jujuba var. spinosa]